MKVTTKIVWPNGSSTDGWVFWDNRSNFAKFADIASGAMRKGAKIELVMDEDSFAECKSHRAERPDRTERPAPERVGRASKVPVGFGADSFTEEVWTPNG